MVPKKHCSLLEALEEPVAFIYLEDGGSSSSEMSVTIYHMVLQH
jgi:hypothetical protein